MNRLRTSALLIILLMSVVGIIGVVSFIQTAEAKHTKTIVDWGWYKCSEIDTGVICIDWIIRTRSRQVEGWWHKLFGKHPHGHKWVWVKHDPLHEQVLSCSKCNPAF